MANKKINYSEAYNELTNILSKIESGELDVDDLAKHVKKASELLKICKTKLYDTETEIEKILEDIDSGDE